MNLPRLQALAAPLTAPVPSAISISAEAYQYILSTGIHVSFAWVAAIGAFVGIETVGGASCYAAVKLHRQKNYGIEFWVSLVGVAVYIYSGWLTLYNSPTIIFFFLAPFAYFAYSILRSMEQEIGEKESEIEAQIKLIEAKKRLANAEARKIKSGNGLFVREHTDNLADVRGHSTDNDKLIEVIRERSSGSEFGVSEAIEWTEMQRTFVYGLLKYGRETNQVLQVGRGVYKIANIAK